LEYPQLAFGKKISIYLKRLVNGKAPGANFGWAFAKKRLAVGGCDQRSPWLRIEMPRVNHGRNAEDCRGSEVISSVHEADEKFAD
jgi:hypothetical protein